MSWRIGVDIGGTFTDVAMVEENTGQIGIAKVPTTPLDFAEGVLNGLSSALTRAGIKSDDVSLLSHATTIVTNALLEGKGARTAFIGTRGFRDILELRRSVRIDMYDLFQDSPPVLVDRPRRFEITERVDAQGEIVTPLALDEIDGLIEELKKLDCQTIAVSLLFSFLNDSHEKILGERLRAALPDVQVFLSCEVLPEIREFERASTTAVCAYVGPLLKSYLERLQEAVGQIGMPELHVMGSSGGVVDIEECLRMPAQAVESGPAAGVIAAALVGEQMGINNVISFDMGGTTAKASVIVDGEIAVTAEYEVGGAANAKKWVNGTGHPIRVPVIDLAEVSSGGGSIAWIDAGGALKVGPHSAGALPGPVAYGRGGTLPTVTDANVVLGYLNPEYLLDGELKIDHAGAVASIDKHLATPLGMSVTDAAAGIIDVVTANMCAALNIVSVERGLNPQEFTMIAFGGAGPIHALSLASELSIPKVVIPPAPGTFSALGLAATSLKRDYSRTFYSLLDTLDIAKLEASYGAMEAEAEAMLQAANIPAERRSLQRMVDIRYKRQSYELTIPFAGGPVTKASLDALAQAFNQKHLQTYGHFNENEGLQLVNVRLTAIGKLKSLTLVQPTQSEPVRTGERDVWFRSTGLIRAAVVWRNALAVGETVMGPAIIESLDSTLVVPPEWNVSVDHNGFIVAEQGQKNV
jgi:N-methylhydantoinase A